MINPFHPGTVFGAICLVLASTTSSGAVLAEWDFDNNTRNATFTSPGMTASSMQFLLQNTGEDGIGGTTGLQANATVRGVGDTGYVQVFNASTIHARSATEAIAKQEFFEFKMAPTAGNVLSVTELSFYAWSNTNLDDAITYTYFLTSSATGDAILGSYSSTDQLANTEVPDDGNKATFDLSGYNDLASLTSETSFYIGVYMSGSSATGGNFRLDSVEFQGGVSAIPEPSRYMLGMVAVMALVLRRRRATSSAL